MGDLRQLLVQVVERLGLPGNFVDRLPADVGELTVFESDQIDALQLAVRVIDPMSLYLLRRGRRRVWRAGP